ETARRLSWLRGPRWPAPGSPRWRRLSSLSRSAPPPARGPSASATRARRRSLRSPARGFASASIRRASREPSGLLSRRPPITPARTSPRSPTSRLPAAPDAAFAGAKDALIRGVEAAHAVARNRGYGQLRIGFNWAYRNDPASEQQFWTYLRDHGGARFVEALDWVGVDAYPGTVFPP